MPDTYDRPGVYIEEITMPKTIEGVPTSIAAFIGRTLSGDTGVALRCRSHQDFVEAFGGAHVNSEIGDSINLFFANGGAECYVVRLKDDAPDIVAALAALDKIDVISLVVISPDAGVSEFDQRLSLIAASEYCRNRHAFLIADAPASWVGDVDKFPIEDFREGFARENTAVYFPRLKIGDVKEPETVGASGAIAGLYARTDAERGVWKAPAGTSQSARYLGCRSSAARRGKWFAKFQRHKLHSHISGFRHGRVGSADAGWR